MYRASFINLYYDQQMHNYLTNYHTPTCFDTIVSSLGILQSIPCQVTQVFQYKYRASSMILYYDQQMHNYFTNSHTPTCFDTIVSSSGSLYSIPCQVTQVLKMQLYYQLYLKYLCNLARYWIQAPWGRHDSVETCRSVIICEIIVHLLVIVQNKKIEKWLNVKIWQPQRWESKRSNLKNFN